MHIKYHNELVGTTTIVDNRASYVLEHPDPVGQALHRNGLTVKDLDEYIKQQALLARNPIVLDDFLDGLIVKDQVNHPKHYNLHPSGVECIDIVRHMGFNLGNVVKYVWRAGLKDSQPTIQDLEKALWYLQDEIKLRKGER